jgi:hypothetical protein
VNFKVLGSKTAQYKINPNMPIKVLALAANSDKQSSSNVPGNFQHLLPTATNSQLPGKGASTILTIFPQVAATHQQ